MQHAILINTAIELYSNILLHIAHAIYQSLLIRIVHADDTRSDPVPANLSLSGSARPPSPSIIINKDSQVINSCCPTFEGPTG